MILKNQIEGDRETGIFRYERGILCYSLILFIFLINPWSESDNPNIIMPMGR